MPFITLAVISPVIEQVNNGFHFQKQISIREASPDLLKSLKMADKNNKVTLVIYRNLKFLVDDPIAIRWVAQETNKQIEDFSSLYSYLAYRPDESIKFAW